MGRRRFTSKTILTILIFVAALFGCTNPLLEKIREEVEVVITPPTVIDHYPVMDSENIAINLNSITVTFSKSIDSNSVSNSSFFVESEDGAVVSGTRSVEQYTITFTLSTDLNVGERYTVAVDGIQDLDGNPITSRYSWDFTTGIEADAVSPVLSTASVEIVDEDGDGWTTSNTVTLILSASDNFNDVAFMNISDTATFSDSGWISYAESIAVELPEGDGLKELFVKVRDGSGNVSVETGSDSIYLDTAKPEITSLKVNSGSKATNAETVTLNLKAIDTGGSGRNLFRYRNQGGEWSDWSAFSSEDVEEYEYISDLSHNGTEGDLVYFEAQVSDLAGNISDTYTGSIIYELTAPSVTEHFPLASEDFPANANKIYILFSESMLISSISTENLYILHDGSPLYGTSYTYEEVYSEEGIEGLDSEVLYKATISGFDFEQGQEYTAVLDIEAVTTDEEGNEVSVAVPTDKAGNELEATYSWTFSTSDAVDDVPPEGSINLDPDDATNPSVTASTTNSTTTALTITAEDKYNSTYGMKIWGDNNGTLASFEEEAVWEAYGTSKTWTFSSGDGVKYLFYKFMDAASNETDVPRRLKIELDTEPPVIGAEGIVINDGGDYTNNAELIVNLAIDASDATSGISTVHVLASNTSDAAVFTETEVDWESGLESITLPDGDGEKTIEITLTDNTENSVSDTQTVILDLTSPEIILGDENALETNTPTPQPGVYTDANGVTTYYWEQVSGPGTITFSDDSVAAPVVSAGAEGDYEIAVTVTDIAGNSAYGTVPFRWDETAPGSPAGTAPAVSVSEYSQTAQPGWSWDAVEDADFYRISYASSPEWGTPDASGVTGYILLEATSLDFTPAGELPEGSHTLKVKAYDRAGNSTAEGSGAVTIDTIDPVIPELDTYYLKNEDFYIISEATEIVEEGSGIESLTWTIESGPGTELFSDGNIANPQLSATVDGIYETNLTVVDYAGRSTSADYTVVWDTTAPVSPTITGLEHTPNVNPIWNWDKESESGGNGTFEYKIDRRGKEWESNGGGYTGDSETVVDWTITEATSYPNTGLPDKYEYTISVRERDEVGNWSILSEFSTWIDTDYVSAPILNRDGNYLRNAGETSVTWTWESGTGETNATDYYRYSFDNTTWIETDANTYNETLSDGEYTFFLQERNNSTLTFYSDKTATSSVEIDTASPSAPALTVPSITNDSTPTFSWSGDASGAGVYIYEFDGIESDETTATSYTPPAQTDDTYLLRVKERDEAGNWSAWSTEEVTIDTLTPTVSNVLIDSGATYSTDTSLLITFDYTDNPTLMRYYSNGWTDWQTLNASNSITVSDANGSTHYVYVQLQDAAGNISSYTYDTIILDTIAPTFNSFSINSGADSTTSRSVTLNSSVSGATQMRFQNSSGNWSSWYTYSSSLAWTLTGTVNGGAYGARGVNTEYRDAAGNTVSGNYDAIFYGTPELKYASKGAYDDGQIRAYYNGANYSAEIGTNNFYIYYATSATGTKYTKGNTTNTSYYDMTGMTEGTIFYVFLRVYNSEIGYSNYSSYAYGFTSDITIIYDDDDSSDTSIAQNMKNLLVDTDYFDTYSDYINGTMPTWTVTMFPEDFVSSSWTTTDDRYIIYGTPIIITPSSSTIYSYTYRARNVTHKSIATGQDPATVNDGYSYYLYPFGYIYVNRYRAGVVAMGYYGSRYLNTVANNALSWGIDGSSNYKQSPGDIDSGSSMISSTPTAYGYQWTTDSSVWSSPLSSTVFSGGPSPLHNSSTQLSYTEMGGAGGNLYRSMVSLPGGATPTNGDILMRDYASTSHFSVVRQGRFMHFGLPIMPDRPYTGKVFFVNTMALMDNY